MSTALTLLMVTMFSSKVRAINDDGLRREVRCSQNCFVSWESLGELATTTSSSASLLSTREFETPAAVALSSSPAATTLKEANARLSIGTKMAIGIGTGTLLLLLAYMVLETCHVCKRRQGKALPRAVDEVEAGREPDKGTGVESKEMVVLESRVEIVVEESEGEEGWEADMEDAEEEEEGEGEDEERCRARNGMSLPRRVYG